MPQMIRHGSELIRISDRNPAQLEYSKNDGRTRIMLCSGTTSVGEFIDLTDNGREILAKTTRGLFYSKNGGRTCFYNCSCF